MFLLAPAVPFYRKADDKVENRKPGRGKGNNDSPMQAGGFVIKANGVLAAWHLHGHEADIDLFHFRRLAVYRRAPALVIGNAEKNKVVVFQHRGCGKPFGILGEINGSGHCPFLTVFDIVVFR